MNELDLAYVLEFKSNLKILNKNRLAWTIEEVCRFADLLKI
jgi:hypothetical protein